MLSRKKSPVFEPNLKIAERVAGTASPLAVRPRAEDDAVRRRWDSARDRFVNAQRAVEIVRVVPSAHGEHSRRDVPEMRRDFARLPEGVQRPVRHHVVPERRAALDVQFVGVRQRPHREEERVAVVGAVAESSRAIGRRRRTRRPLVVKNSNALVSQNVP